MNDIIAVTGGLPDLSVSQMVALPHERLQELDGLLNEMQTELKRVRERLNAALEQRYGEEGRAALLASGRDFGVTHLADGPLRVTYELPKRVVYDQPTLRERAQRIAAAGERVEDYLDVELSIPESRWSAWPPALKEQFAPARTVKAGKASFRLALVGKGA